MKPNKVTRTIEAFERNASTASPDTPLVFENVYKLLSVQDEMAIARAIKSNVLYALSLIQCKFCFRSQNLVNALSETSSLKKLSLALNPLHESIDVLKKIIQNNNSLEVLDLRSTELNDHDLSIICNALKESSKLSHIQLSGNHFTKHACDLAQQQLEDIGISLEVDARASQDHTDSVGANISLK